MSTRSDRTHCGLRNHMKLLSYKAMPFIVVAFCLFSCSPKQTIETEQISLNKSFCLTQACNDSLSLSFELEFPTLLDDKDALNAIQQDLIANFFGKDFQRESLSKAIDDYVVFSRDEYIANNRAFASRLEEKENEFAAVLSEEQAFSGRVLSFYKGVLTYEFEHYAYMGGAHGVNNRLFYNYDVNSGERLYENDIFRDGYEDSLTSLLQNTLIEQSEEFSGKEDFLDAGFEFDSIRPNGNFALTEDAVIYVFNPYEIAPYVFGETEIVLDKSLLRSILKKRD